MSLSPPFQTPDILCIGAVLWDIIGRTPGPVALGDDLPGRISRAPGGVALNIALALARFGMTPALLSAVGRDAEGEALVAACDGFGLITGHLYRPDSLPTDRYMAIEGPGGLIAAIADAQTLEAAGDSILRPMTDGRLGSQVAPWSGLVVIDGNLTPALLADIAAAPQFAAADLRIAAASPDKAARLKPFLRHPRATLYLNLAEARVLGGNVFASAREAATGLLAMGAARVLVTDGGELCAEASLGLGMQTGQPPRVAIARVTGAGDHFMAGHIAAEHRGAGRDDALAKALAAAADHISKEI